MPTEIHFEHFLSVQLDRWKQKSMFHKVFRRYAHWIPFIDNLYDFGVACVLASAGLLESGTWESLNIKDIDLSSVPINLVKCLAKNVRELNLTNAAGFGITMLEDTEKVCFGLTLNEINNGKN